MEERDSGYLALPDVLLLFGFCFRGGRTGGGEGWKRGGGRRKKGWKRGGGKEEEGNRGVRREREVEEEAKEGNRGRRGEREVEERRRINERGTGCG